MLDRYIKPWILDYITRLELVIQVQSNLDYSKCQGPQESFRIIGSSNDQNREFSDIFGKLGCFHRMSLFTSLTGVFHGAIRTSVKALKKMSS